MTNPTHPDEMSAATDDVIPRPTSPTAHVDRAKRLVQSSKIVFRSATEMADWLNAYGGGKFVAIVVEGNVIVGAPNHHPDSVLAEYYALEDKTPYIVPLPTREVVEPVRTEPTEGAPPLQTTRLPGAPPKFQAASTLVVPLPEAGESGE